MFRRHAIERDAQLLQIGREGFIRYFGEFVVKERLSETLIEREEPSARWRSQDETIGRYNLLEHGVLP